jgi:ABC-type uncharacterized transport system auxiliary subunit
MRTRIFFAPVSLVVLVALLLVQGCRSAVGPRDIFHRIEAPPPAAAAPAPVLDGVLEIDRLRGEAVLAALPLLYRRSASSQEILRYGYHLWTDPAPVMLQRAIGARIEASGWVARVVYPEQRVRPDYVLRGRIERLEHHRDEHVAVIALQLDLVEEQRGRPVHSGHYTERVEAADASVGASVEAYGIGLGRILERFWQELEDAPAEES